MLEKKNISRIVLFGEISTSCGQMEFLYVTIYKIVKEEICAFIAFIQYESSVSVKMFFLFKLRSPWPLLQTGTLTEAIESRAL